MKIDLGCGPLPREGYLGLDLRALPGVDIACDIRRLPLESECCEAVRASNVLEHIEELVRTMEEIYRVCRDGAVVEIIVPYQYSNWATSDPTHVRQFNEDSFFYFCPTAWGPTARSYGYRTNFHLVEISYEYTRFLGGPVGRLPHFLKTFLRRHINNIALTMRVTLQCVKPSPSRVT
jgi:SAM-dependent methyltransferase